MLAAAEAPTTWLTLFPLWFWYVAVFLLGTCIGSFLNVCIHRLPLEKSLLWPGSRRPLASKTSAAAQARTQPLTISRSTRCHRPAAR